MPANTTNDDVDNKTNMIRTTVEYDKKPASVTATTGIPSYATVLALVATKLVLIDQLNLIYSGTSKGVTLDTIALKKAMCFLAGKIGQALAAYAASVNNNTLYVLANYTEAQLMKEKKDVVDDKCQAIHDAGVSNLLAAGGFGYASADNVALDTAITLYRAGADDPRQAIISKSQALAQIQALQKDIISNLFKKQLDKMAYTLRGTANEFFYDGHSQARVIVDAGNVTGKISVKVLNSLGQALKDVTVTVTRSDNGALVKSVKTNDKGAASVTKLFGKYNITYEKTGGVTQTESNVDVGAGKKVQRQVTMVSLSGQPLAN